MTRSIPLRHRARRADDGFALVAVMLLVVMMGTVSLTVLGVMLNETRPTAVSRKTVETVNSANAGLQAALSRLRAANTNGGAGKITDLPCGQLTGTVSGSARDTYTTRILYFSAAHNPSTLSAADQALYGTPCPVPNQVPAYALLTNAGTSTATPAGHGNRTFQATYVFSTTNANPVGGRMMNSSNSMCWDVGSSPAPGSAVTWQPCLAYGVAQQTWTYRPDLSLFWAGGGLGANLCLDDSGYFAQTASPRNAMALTLQTCLEPDPGTVGTYPYSPPAEQYQEFGAHYKWWAVKANGDGGPSGDCIGPGNAAVATGAAVTMASNSNDCTDLNPENPVGAGAAAGIVSGLPGPTQQLVNYEEFGRCFDVQRSNPNLYIIAFPCHAAPNTGAIEENQKFYFSGTAGGSGTLQTTRSPNYGWKCVTSPLSSGPKVAIADCDGSASQTWTFAGPVPGSYARSYTVTDANGMCLSLAPAIPQADGWKYAIVKPCDGTDSQKWNAPAGTSPQALTDIVETPGR